MYRLRLLILMWFCLVASCGIFDPRSVEDPLGPASDPLKLGEILNGTHENISKVQYQDIIVNEARYVHNPVLLPASGQDLIRRFEDIKLSQAVIEIYWADDSRFSDITGFDDSIVTFRKYLLRYSDVQNIEVTVQGAVEIKWANQADLNTWKITYWKDSPDSAIEKSFFYPFYGEQN